MAEQRYQAVMAVIGDGLAGGGFGAAAGGGPRWSAPMRAESPASSIGVATVLRTRVGVKVAPPPGEELRAAHAGRDQRRDRVDPRRVAGILQTLASFSATRALARPLALWRVWALPWT